MKKLYTPEFGILCLAILLFFCSYHVLTPVFPMFLEDNAVSGVEIGLLVSLFMVASMAAKPWIGKLADEMSRKTLMLLGLLTFGLCPLLYLLAMYVPALFYVARILHGASFAVFYTAASSYMVNLVPPERKAEGISYFSNSIKVAMAIAPGLGLFLVDQEWMLLSFWAAALGSLVVLPLILSLKPLEQAAKTVKKGKLINIQAVFPGCLMATNSIVFGALIPYFPLLANEKGLENAHWFYVLYAVFLIASRFLTGKLSDRFGRKRVVLPGMGMVFLALILMSALEQPWAFPILAGFYGLAAGTVQPSLMALAAERAESSEQGSAMATFSLLTDMGNALGMFLMGSLGHLMGYSNTLLVIATVVAGGILVLSNPSVLSSSVSSVNAKERATA